jgi:hypothetical protein
MLETEKSPYLTEEQARALRACMRADTAQGRRLRNELVNLVTMWMHEDREELARLAPIADRLLRDA